MAWLRRNTSSLRKISEIEGENEHEDEVFGSNNVRPVFYQSETDDEDEEEMMNDKDSQR